MASATRGGARALSGDRGASYRLRLEQPGGAITLSGPNTLGHAHTESHSLAVSGHPDAHSNSIAYSAVGSGDAVAGAGEHADPDVPPHQQHAADERPGRQPDRHRRRLLAAARLSKMRWLYDGEPHAALRWGIQRGATAGQADRPHLRRWLRRRLHERFAESAKARLHG